MWSSFVALVILQFCFTSSATYADEVKTISTETSASAQSPVQPGTKAHLLIGGGPRIERSQVSILKNTEWLLSLDKTAFKDYETTLLFTDGEDAAVDVITERPPDPESSEDIEKLRSHKDRFYTESNSTFEQNVGSATASSVTETLNEILQNTRRPQRLLLTFQGHGRRDAWNTNDNSLHLWDDTTLTVSALGEQLDQLLPEQELIFVFPQCYSGAFGRLAFKGLDAAAGLASGVRCGFVSQLEQLESEGCTASVNQSSYRDYSSYFFAALAGEDRLAQPLTESPDYDDDGKVAFTEAHRYALRNSETIDFARATSEIFLEDWQGWRTRWLPARLDPASTHYIDAMEILSRLQVDGSDPVGAQKSQDALADEVDQLRQLLDARTAKHDAMVDGISNDDPALIQRAFAERDALISRRGELLQKERRLAGFKRASKLLDLARIDTLLHQFGTEQNKADLAALRQCENLYP